MSLSTPLQGLFRQLLPSFIRREAPRITALSTVLSLRRDQLASIRYSSSSTVEWRRSGPNDGNDDALLNLLPEYLKFAEGGDPASQYSLSMCLLMKYLSLTSSYPQDLQHDLATDAVSSQPREVKRSHFFKWVRKERERLMSENSESYLNAEAEDHRAYLEEAVRFLQQSSDAGYHESTYLLGALLYEGYYKFVSVEGRSKEDELKGLQLLWKAATGYTVPNSFLEAPTEDGVVSMLKADALLEKREENPFALFDLATAYFTGSEFLGIQPNLPVSLALYMEAAVKNKDADAMFWVGYIYWTLYSQKLQIIMHAPPPPSMEDAPEQLEKEFAATEDAPFRIRSEANLEEAVRIVGELRNKALQWLSKAANEEHVEAIHFLGSVFFEAKDLPNAVAYMEQAADLGHQRALHILGDWYCQGKSVAPHIIPDYRKALQCYDRAISAPGYNNGENTENVEQLRALSYLNKGSMLMKGLGCKADPVKAHDCYTKAANLGNAEACWRLYDLIRLGVGAPKDEAVAKKYLNRAVELQKQLIDSGKYDTQQILTPT